LDWLRRINKDTIQHATNGGEFRIPGTRYQADGFCKETNTVYEFYGDRWHGNPAKYQADAKCHPYNNTPAGQLYEKTLKREYIIRNLGYNLVTVWESDFRKAYYD
jgi:G:T-mismatch repair DNA endonuclease (very short patch repair protein)